MHSELGSDGFRGPLLTSPVHGGKMAERSCPIRTSFASGSFATSMRQRRRQRLPWPRKADGTGRFARTRKKLQGSLM